MDGEIAAQRDAARIAGRGEGDARRGESARPVDSALGPPCASLAADLFISLISHQTASGRSSGESAPPG